MIIVKSVCHADLHKGCRIWLWCVILKVTDIHGVLQRCTKMVSLYGKSCSGRKESRMKYCIIPGPCIILTCDLLLLGQCRSEAIHLTRSTSIAVLFYYFSVDITFLYIYTIYPNTQVQYFSPGENSPNNNYF